jgi:hypothetical protein
LTQLDLFGNEVRGIEFPGSPIFSVDWSYSKMQAFRDCPRKYYFLYYGSKKKKALNEPLKERLIELARMSNKYMVQGNLIHQMISLYFKKAKQGELWDLKRLTSFVSMIVNETFVHNENVRAGRAVENLKYPKPVLKELFYSSVDDGQLKKEILDVTIACLTHFFLSDLYEPIRRGGALPSSVIEGDTTFSINDVISVDGKVDIAYVDDSRLIITDWKTGKREMQDTSLQLLVYALWARQLKDWKFAVVDIQKGYLADGSLEKLQFSETHIHRARVRIMQDAELLMEMDEYGKGSVRDAFAKHEGKNCKTCPFEEICFQKLS